MRCTAGNNFRKFFCGPCANTCWHAPPKTDWRTQLSYGTRERHASYRYALSRVLSLCCRCGTAAVLLLLGLFCFYCYAVPWYIFIDTSNCCWNSTVVRFCSVESWEVELRDLSLYQVCVRPRMCAYESRTTCGVWYTLSAAAARCCC